MKLIKRTVVLLCIVGLSGCAFVPRNVDVNSVKSRIHIPTENYNVSKHIEFLPTIDKRSDPGSFGYIRNKLMMVTSFVSMSGDLSETVDQMVKKNFQLVGIGDGNSSYQIRTKILEAHTDVLDPNNIFVRIRIQIGLTDKNTNMSLLHEVISGYSVVGVMQLDNFAHESAFVNAMNQINEKVYDVAKVVEKHLAR
tara:strand:- start:51 stop:635 length:585 start_codon:yes stop_codon:yes gene_type:complete